MRGRRGLRLGTPRGRQFARARQTAGSAEKTHGGFPVMVSLKQLQQQFVPTSVQRHLDRVALVDERRHDEFVVDPEFQRLRGDQLQPDRLRLGTLHAGLGVSNLAAGH